MSQDNKELKIVVFPSDRWGCGYYRMVLPATKLHDLGHHVCISWDFKNFPMDADIYHFQRVTTPGGLEAMKLLHGMNKLVMMDMDDDLFHLYPGHPSEWYFRPGMQCLSCGETRMPVDKNRPRPTKCTACGSTNLEFQDRLKCCGDAFHHMDYLTVSTPEIDDRFGATARKSKILPNYVDMRAYDLPDKGNEYTAVGWFGSFTHTRDLGELFGVLDLLKDYDDKTVFMTAGEQPQTIRQMFATDAVLDKRIITLEPAELVEYPELLKNIDISLAPLQDNGFNRMKSELKAIEAGAAKCPIIASNVAPYTRYIEHGVTGFLVKKHRDWSKYIRLLLDNPDLRKQMAQANYDKAMTMDINTRIFEREEFYREAVEEHAKKYPHVHTPYEESKKPNPFKLGV